MSPTQRTIAALKSQGLDSVNVEFWNPHVGYRQDYLGIMDRQVLIPGGGIMGIQICANTDYAKHYEKITIAKADNTRKWLATGSRLQIWAWRKLKVKRGGRATKWEPRIVEITLNDLEVKHGEG